MPMMRTALGFAAALGLWARPVEGVTPVQKVIELLENLSKKIEEEGKAEAAAYDKYACFCKEQVDDKQYAIEKSNAKIEKLDSEIDKLSAEITALEDEIGELETKISNKQQESKDAQAARDLEHGDYVTKEADAAGAIDACKRAIEALKDSKKNLGGKSELEAALVQVRSLASTALALSAATGSGVSSQQMKELAKLSQPGAAYEYSYHSNSIIETIEGLLDSFTKIKADLDQVEFDQHTAHDKKQLGLANEIKFAEKDRDEKAALAEGKTEEKNAKDADRTQEKKDRQSDQEFQAVLTDECSAKATLWDQRSSTRSQELTAISEAMASLKDGVAPNWQANKKLVGIQKHQEVTHGHWVYVQEDSGRPASFLQVRRGAASAERRTANKVRVLLAEAAQRLRSPMLTALALKVTSAEDHFVKVRSIIKDLLARLDAEADAEATQKGFCDTEMAAAISKRDEEQNKVEDAKAKIAQAESKIAQLKQDIADLTAAIAENIKALKEATDLRDAENIENTKTIADAGAGKQAVELALNVLKNFYENAAFVQKRAGYVPPNSDREGLTVSDRAPEVFDAEYKGSQDASKGIVGMLEVILTDFDRTVTTVTQEESDAQQAYDTFKDTNERDTAEKEGLVTTKEGELASTEDDLVGFQGDLKSASESKEDAEKALEKLKPMCVEGEETYEERVEKRKQEIEALKEAHDILENWQK